MNNSQRSSLESLADQVEGVARDVGLHDTAAKELMKLAWDLKQVARRGTPSEGV